MKPTIGRIVHYRLIMQDVEAIESRRAPRSLTAFAGGEAVVAPSRGNQVREGDTFPAMIVRVWGDKADSLVQLQVFLDGNDQHWATSVQRGDVAGTWCWPPIPAATPAAPIGVGYGDRI